jgi:hypothetical protein
MRSKPTRQIGKVVKGSLLGTFQNEQLCPCSSKERSCQQAGMQTSKHASKERNQGHPQEPREQQNNCMQSKPVGRARLPTRRGYAHTQGKENASARATQGAPRGARHAGCCCPNKPQTVNSSRSDGEGEVEAGCCTASSWHHLRQHPVGTPPGDKVLLRQRSGPAPQPSRANTGLRYNITLHP